jgi:hypothetical protein
MVKLQLTALECNASSVWAAQRALALFSIFYFLFSIFYFCRPAV